MSQRRDAILAGASALLVLGATHALTKAIVNPAEWRPMVLLAIVVATGIAAVLRIFHLHWAWSVVGSLLGLVTFTYVVHLPAGGLIPGLEQWDAFVDLLGRGLLEFRDQAAPSSPLAGLLLIVTTATWVVTHVVHEFIVRWSKPGLALLTAGALWAVPLAVPQPPTRTWPHVIPFLAAAGLVLLLLADVDVVGWARDRTGLRVSTGGIVVGTVALVIAATWPTLLPGYGEEAWLDLAGADVPAYQPIVDVGDRLLLPAETEVLLVESDRPVYLRIAGLDTFDGQTWLIGPAGTDTYSPDPTTLHYAGDGPLPPEVPLGETTRVTTTVTVQDLANTYVPVPYQAVEIDGPRRKSLVYAERDGFVVATDEDVRTIEGLDRLKPQVVEGFRYSVIADVPTPSFTDLVAVDYGAADVDRWLQLPGRFQRLADQAEQVYATWGESGATTAVEKAFALQEWFATSGEFAYSTDPAEVDRLLGSGAVEEFVFENRTGYCEYFSTSMAIMLRATGVPARVAVGFLPGSAVVQPGLPEGVEQAGRATLYSVTTNDAHAWVEVLFPGHGWVKFDPTPRSDGATMPPQISDLDPELTIAERTNQAGTEDGADVPDLTDEDIPDPEGLPPGVDLDPLPEDGAGVGVGRGGLVLLGLLTLLVVSLVAWFVALWRRRPHHRHIHGADRVLAAQRRVHIMAARYGLGRRPHETAREVARRWVRDGHVPAEPASGFVSLSEAAAFGGELPEQAGEQAEALGDQLVASMRTSIGARERFLAPVRLPTQQAWRGARGIADRLRPRGRR